MSSVFTYPFWNDLGDNLPGLVFKDNGYVLKTFSRSLVSYDDWLNGDD